MQGVGTWTGTACKYATVELAATAADEGDYIDVIAKDVRGDRILAV